MVENILNEYTGNCPNIIRQWNLFNGELVKSYSKLQGLLDKPIFKAKLNQLKEKCGIEKMPLDNFLRVKVFLKRLSYINTPSETPLSL
jgi:hypothetical protein